ncbi:hypothetical protein ACFSUK_15800 [Sphingobium scionense]
MRSTPGGTGRRLAIIARRFPALFAALIDQWCEEARRLAFAWRECQLIAARELRYVPVCDHWAAMWRAFWEEICTRCGHPGRGAHTAYLFDGEASLHLMRWRRPVDRAALEEVCAGWNDWLCVVRCATAIGGISPANRPTLRSPSRRSAAARWNRLRRRR